MERATLCPGCGRRYSDGRFWPEGRPIDVYCSADCYREVNGRLTDDSISRGWVRRGQWLLAEIDPRRDRWTRD